VYATACHHLLEVAWPVTRVYIGQYRQADYRHAVMIKDTVVVDEHASGETSLPLTLNFHMDQQPALLTITETDLHQFVRMAPTSAAIAGDLLQLLVEKDQGLGPVYSGMNIRVEQLHEGLEEVFQRLLPRAVVIL